jgi:hypothetical protein
MNQSLRFLICVAYICSVLAAMHHFQLGGFAELVLETANLAEARSLSREPESRMDAILAVESAKCKVLEELVNGKVTLREAAARFQELDQTVLGQSWPEFRRIYAGRSDEERYCRKVVIVARGYLESSPDQSDAVMLRLETELQAQLEQEQAGLAE